MRSPCCDGMVDTRTSTSCPPTRSDTRPSCGSRLSAMSSRAITLIRLARNGASDRLGSTIVRITPATRNRTSRRRSSVSMRMSDARSRIAPSSSALIIPGATGAHVARVTALETRAAAQWAARNRLAEETPGLSGPRAAAAGFFGLIHGFGFAGLMADTGLTGARLAVACSASIRGPRPGRLPCWLPPPPLRCRRALLP